MRKVLTGAVAALAVFGCVLSVAATAGETLRIGTEGAYAPFNVIEPDGTVTGFDLDLAFALCKKMDVECSVYTQEWTGLIPALKARKFDFIIASMSITDERLREIDFTDRYYTNKLNFVAKKGVLADNGKESMKGKSVGVQEGTLAEEWLTTNYPDTIVKKYETQQKAYHDLVTGQLDAVLADMLVNWSWVETPEGKGFEFLGEPVFDDDKVGIGVRKEDSELKERLNQALVEVLADGTYQTINARYFPFSIY